MVNVCVDVVKILQLIAPNSTNAYTLSHRASLLPSTPFCRNKKHSQKMLIPILILLNPFFSLFLAPWSKQNQFNDRPKMCFPVCELSKPLYVSSLSLHYKLANTSRKIYLSTLQLLISDYEAAFQGRSLIGSRTRPSSPCGISQT